MWGEFIKHDRIIEMITDNFETALDDIRALNTYFSETRDLINQKKFSFYKKYKYGYKLSELFDNIYLHKEEEIPSCIDDTYGMLLDDTLKVQDVVSIKMDSNNKTLFYTLKDNYKKSEYNPKIAREKIKVILNQENIFVRSVLSNIVVIFEQFLASQYETLVISQPKKYFEDKKISVCDLLDGDLAQIILKLIKKEVESNMFDSIKTLNKIREKSKIDVDRYIEIKNAFEEIHYRRNAYIHTNGTANETYLSKVQDIYTKNIKFGQKLVCDDIYLENAIATLSKIVASLHFELLNTNNAAKEEFSSIENFGFDALQQKQYSLAEYIYGLLRKQRNFEYSTKIRYEINFINALKLQGKDVQNLIETFDVSIAEDTYKIAKECLKDNHKETYDLLNKSYPNSFNASMIREWPIFIKFRESEYYNQFVEEHHADFESYAFENVK